MTYAVEVPELNAICFVVDRPEPRDGMTVIEGAWIDVPMNLFLQSPGAKDPDQVLSQNEDDPLHYKLFKYRDELISSGFRDTGMHFGGTFSKAAWGEFLDNYDALRPAWSIPDGEDR